MTPFYRKFQPHLIKLHKIVKNSHKLYKMSLKNENYCQKIKNWPQMRVQSNRPSLEDTDKTVANRASYLRTKKLVYTFQTHLCLFWVSSWLCTFPGPGGGGGATNICYIFSILHHPNQAQGCFLHPLGYPKTRVIKLKE